MCIILKIFIVFCFSQLANTFSLRHVNRYTLKTLSTNNKPTTPSESDELYPQVTASPIDVQVKLNRTMINAMKYFIPNITEKWKKGQLGTIGIIGGSREYSGPPYFSGIAALKTGADLAYVFTTYDTVTAIKSHSPEIKVFPCLDSKNVTECIKPWLLSLTALIIGPGLGNQNETITNNIVQILLLALDEWLPMLPIIIDGDGLFLVYNHLRLLKDYPGYIYITIYHEEFIELASTLFNVNKTDIELDKYIRKMSIHFHREVVILLKGEQDMIAHENTVVTSLVPGSPKSPLGQGDLLAGCLAVFSTWLFLIEYKDFGPFTPELVISFTASTIIKMASKLAYKQRDRSMITTDIAQNIHRAYNMLFRSKYLPRI